MAQGNVALAQNVGMTTVARTGSWGAKHGLIQNSVSSRTLMAGKAFISCFLLGDSIIRGHRTTPTFHESFAPVARHLPDRFLQGPTPMRPIPATHSAGLYSKLAVANYQHHSTTSGICHRAKVIADA